VARHGPIPELLAGCESIAAYNGDNYLPLVWRFYRSHRSTLFRLAHTLQFTAATQEHGVLEALEVVLAHEHARDDWLPRRRGSSSHSPPSSGSAVLVATDTAAGSLGATLRFASSVPWPLP
jgi:hypothetical protein